MTGAKKRVRYRKVAHQVYVVWVDGVKHTFENSRHAKKFFKSKLIEAAKG
jgi:hypothetical protein